jgi:small-conductance mechanosensitive channel
MIGLYRILLTRLGRKNDIYSPWECVTQSPYALYHIGVVLSTVVSLVISIDRFIAVNWPMKYRSFDEKYTRKVLWTLIIFSILVLTFLFIFAYLYTGPGSARSCNFPQPLWSAALWYTFLAGIGCLSVGIYFGVYIAFRRASRNVLPMPQMRNNAVDQSAIAQHRLTVTLGMITISTSVFFVIPYSMIAWYTWTGDSMPFSVAIANLTRFSPIIHVVIYVSRQSEIRAGM